jgi:hypothetical protein
MDKNKRVIARDISKKELVEKVKELTRKDKERKSSKKRK